MVILKKGRETFESLKDYLDADPRAIEKASQIADRYYWVADTDTDRVGHKYNTQVEAADVVEDKVVTFTIKGYQPEGSDEVYIEDSDWEAAVAAFSQIQ